jgi:hypothetical protein
MNDAKRAALVAFDDQTRLDKAGYELMRVALETKPRAMLLIWETADEGIGMATLPHSIAVARGLSDLAYTALWTPEDEDS